MQKIKQKNGQITILMVFIITIMICASLSLLTLLANWHGKVKLQHRLDVCVSEVARELKNLQNIIEASNSRIKSLRISIAVAVDPRIQSALKLWLKAEVTAQDFQRMKWETKRVAWLIRRGCHQETNIPIPLPSLSWKRPPPDVIGDSPLYWEGDTKLARLKIVLIKNPRGAAAQVFNQESKWKAAWTSAH